MALTCAGDLNKDYGMDYRYVQFIASGPKTMRVAATSGYTCTVVIKTPRADLHLDDIQRIKKLVIRGGQVGIKKPDRYRSGDNGLSGGCSTSFSRAPISY
jgi:hypothetical protein